MGRNVAGYQATVTFDTSALRYVESANGDYLPAGAFFVPPNVSGNQVSLSAVALAGESSGNGTLARVTFEVIAVKASTLTLSDVVLSDSAGVGSHPQVENGQITRPSVVVNKPDLVVQSPGVSKSTLSPGESFTLSATVSNSGSGRAAATTLRYYRSTNTTISRSDTQVGSSSVFVSLGANSDFPRSITLNAPTTPGTYYYGACVDAVANEADTTNNCSTAVTVTVVAPTVNKPDLVVNPPRISKSTLSPGESFTLSATVRNSGSGGASATTLRYYRSTNTTISRTDSQVGTDAVSSLNANSGSPESITLNALTTPGTYYYGACVDAVSNEADTTNNCSTAITVTVESPAQPVTIPDPNLRAKIESALGKASGDTITTADMLKLTKLEARRSNITDLTGLEHATNLTELNLWYNTISDISVVSRLTNLTGLWLGGNTISDISVVASLTNLTHLVLSKNTISDISELAGLTNLTHLFLDQSNISDISVVTDLTNLQRLHLEGNNISDLSPLVSNTGLGKGDVVHVKRNPLNAASINTHIPTLKERGVEVNFDAPTPVTIPDPNLRAKIEEALGKASGAPITTADMATLTTLTAWQANIRDLTGLEHATNLTELVLWGNNITNISALSGLTNLTKLHLQNNSISDISALSGLTKLIELVLFDNNITNISALAG